RGVLGEGLGLLGSALLDSGDQETADQSLRLAVQYAVGTALAADAYARLGAAHVRAERFGEAIAPLRHAVSLGIEPERVLPELSLGFFRQGRHLAAWSAISEARSHGLSHGSFEPLERAIADRIPALTAWTRWCSPPRE